MNTKTNSISISTSETVEGLLVMKTNGQYIERFRKNVGGGFSWSGDGLYWNDIHYNKLPEDALKAMGLKS